MLRTLAAVGRLARRVVTRGRGAAAPHGKPRRWRLDALGWLSGLGAVFVALTALHVAALLGYWFPTPGGLYGPVVLIATLLSGVSCGLVGTLISVFYASWYFAQPGPWLPVSAYTEQRLIGLAISLTVTVLVLGYIRNRMLAARAQLALRVQELERARNALHASEQRLHRLMRNMPGSIFTRTLDDAGRLNYVQFVTQPRSVLGATPAQIEADSSNVTNRVHPEDRAKFWQTMRDSAATMTPYTVEFRIVRDDGSVRWLQSSCTPYRLDSGTVAWDGISIEITEQKQHAVRLQQALHLQALGNLTQGIAHEYNNQLQIILGGLELLEQQATDGPATDLLKQMHASAEKAATISKRLLVFSRQRAQEPQVTDVNAVVTDAVHLLAGLWPAKIQIKRRLAPDLNLAQGDRALLADALVSLMLNARDAMSEGGTLTIETREARSGEGPTGNGAVGAHGPWVAIGVSDTGPGMSEEVARRAFDTFFTTRPVGQGTGLGLSLVYSFSQQAGGYVDLNSAPGRGTTVTLYLPKAGPDAPP